MPYHNERDSTLFCSDVFEVQGVTLNGRGGNIKVTCMFAGDKGCSCRVFIGSVGGLTQHNSVFREDTSTLKSPAIFTGLNNGTYLVTVACITADGSFNTDAQPSSQFYTATDAAPPSEMDTDPLSTVLSTCEL